MSVRSFGKQWLRSVSSAALYVGALSACSAPSDQDLGEEADALRAEEETVEQTAQPVLDGPVNSTPTVWAWYHGQTSAQVDALINNQNLRLVSLQVESASPLLFTVAAVRNTGTHARTSWWVHSQTESQLDSFVAAKSGRILDIQAYEVNGSTRFAAIVVSNTGSNAKNWWWAHGKTPEELGALLTANNARPIDLHSYTVNGTIKYAAVLLQNTGADGKAWWWYFGRTGSQVAAAVRETGASLTSIHPTPDGKFDVILEPGDGTQGWWWFDQTAEGVALRAAETGSRIVDVKAYTAGSARRFVAIFVNNSDAETTRIGNILRNGDHRGSPGFIVKRVGGAIESALNIDFAFDPASSIKALVALHAMIGVQRGGLSLTTPINVHKDLFGDCPPADLTGTQEPVGDALTHMLVRSDNQRTRAFMDWFSMPALEATGREIGMTKLKIVSYPGCSSFANRWSLRDATRLYEGIMDGTLLNAGPRAELFARMPADGGDSSGALGGLFQMVDNEAAALPAASALTPLQIDQFKARLKTHYKGGNHWNPLFWEDVQNVSLSGIARIPACSGSSVVSRDYVWGLFIHNGDYGRTAGPFEAAKVEPLRRAVRSSLSTWRACAR